MRRTLYLCIVLLFFCLGCSSVIDKRVEKTAQELINDGIKQYQKRNYISSIESFETLKDWYPFSKYAILAELKIADANYKLKHYDEAVAAYESFENLHPNNEAIPYVVYQIGLCFFDQMDSVDRDQISTQKALFTFRRFIKQFPENENSTRAKKHIKKCLKSLAGHEFYVGQYYYKTKHYKAALYRFKSILLNYPDLGVHRKALHYIALCEVSMTKNKEKK